MLVTLRATKKINSLLFARLPALDQADQLHNLLIRMHLLITAEIQI